MTLQKFACYFFLAKKQFLYESVYGKREIAPVPRREENSGNGVAPRIVLNDDRLVSDRFIACTLGRFNIYIFCTESWTGLKFCGSVENRALKVEAGWHFDEFCRKFILILKICCKILRANENFI